MRIRILKVHLDFYGRNHTESRIYVDFEVQELEGPITQVEGSISATHRPDGRVVWSGPAFENFTTTDAFDAEVRRMVLDDARCTFFDVRED